MELMEDDDAPTPAESAWFDLSYGGRQFPIELSFGMTISIPLCHVHNSV